MFVYTELKKVLQLLGKSRVFLVKQHYTVQAVNTNAASE